MFEMQVQSFSKQQWVIYITCVNKNIRNIKHSQHIMKFPQFHLNSSKLQLSTDANFNNLQNAGIQVSQVTVLTDW